MNYTAIARFEDFRISCFAKCLYAFCSLLLVEHDDALGFANSELHREKSRFEVMNTNPNLFDPFDLGTIRFR